MATTLEKIAKRRCYPVELPNKETINVRAMTIGEHTRSSKLTGDAKFGFWLGCVIVNEDGSQCYPQGESDDVSFGEAVVGTCELDVQSIGAVKAAIDKLEKLPDPKTAIKNSDATGSVDLQSDSPVKPD